MACEQGFTGGGIQVCLFVCSAQNGLKAERDRDVYLICVGFDCDRRGGGRINWHD